MNLLLYSRLALRGLSANKTRTSLTMLGIAIGVAVVILVVAIGEGASKQVTDSINSLGTNLLTIRPGRPTLRITAAAASGTAQGLAIANRLNMADANLIEKDFPTTISAIAPQARTTTQIEMGDKDANTTVMGTSAEYLYVNNATIQSGQMFSDYENQASSKVCVVGTTVVKELMGSANATMAGLTILINHNQFLVRGVLTPKGAGAFGQDQDDVILIPIQTALRRVLNTTVLSMISVRCTSPGMMPLAQQQISALLRNRHHIPPPYPQNDDFQITSQTEIMQRQQSVTGTMTTLLSAVAIISLIVGGIGIMNIMLVSVTERTREIGIRKAVGAAPHDILMQFLIESSLISLIGGVIGVIVGIVGTVILSRLAGWETVIDPLAGCLALFVSAAVGIFFGLYPAQKAAALHPIDALSYE
jgi:putative ABC transport system permease protein